MAHARGDGIDGDGPGTAQDCDGAFEVLRSALVARVATMCIEEFYGPPEDQRLRTTT